MEPIVSLIRSPRMGTISTLRWKMLGTRRCGVEVALKESLSDGVIDGIQIGPSVAVHLQLCLNLRFSKFDAGAGGTLGPSILACPSCSFGYGTLGFQEAQPKMRGKRKDMWRWRREETIKHLFFIVLRR